MRIRDEQGAELIEFAVILPLLVMVLIGMFWFARAFNIYETLTRAAREGALYGARPQAALDTEFKGCTEMPGFPCSSDIAARIAPMLQAAKIDPATLAKLPSPTPNSCRGTLAQLPCPAANNGVKAPCASWGGGKIWVCRCVDMNNGASPSECGVSVTMAYPWRWRLPFTGLDNLQINIPASVQERQEF